MDIQQLSAESSALKNTLGQAEDSIENPFDYAIEKQMPNNAVQWLAHDPVGTNSISAASSVQFELQRYGYLRGCVFECDFSVAALAAESGTHGYQTVKNVKNVFPRLIDEIEFHSSSRRLARLSGKDYYALLKNSANDSRVMLATNMLCGGDADFSDATAATTGKFRIPLLFSFFENVATSVDSSFVEPLRITVKFGDLIVGAQTAVKGTPVAASVLGRSSATLTNPKLHCEYRTLSREMTDMTVESNYSQPLTQYSYDFVDENPKDFLGSSSSSQTVRVPLTDNSCITDIYVYLEKPVETMVTVGAEATVDADIAERGIPLPLIESVKLVCSGQTICEMSPEVMDLFSYKASNGGNYYGGEMKLTSTSTHNTSHTENVMRIPLALVNEHATANTGSLALRELGNPEIVIVCKATSAADNDVKHRANVILRAQRLISTDPSSGRMVVSVQS